MPPAARITTAALSWALLLGYAAHGLAQTPPSAPTLAPKLELEGPEAEAKDRARALFQQGVGAYREGRFYDAVSIFLQTQRVYPDNQLCFNIARAYENLGNSSAALRYYRDYLRQADRPSDGEEVRQRVRGLEQQLAQRGVQQLTVISQPESATVVLDGKPVGIAPWTGETYPGRHRLLLSLDGFTSHEQIVEVDAYAAVDTSVALTPIPKPVVRPTVALPPPKQPGVSVATLVTLGASVVLLGSAIAAEAASKEPGMSRPTAFFAGSGLGLATVGGVMLYFDLSPGSSAWARKDSALLRP